MWVWSALATIGAGGMAYVRWRSDSTETTAAVWREEAQAWKAKADRLEKSLADLTRRVDKLEAENNVLRSVADPRAEISALRDAVVSGFAEMRVTIGGDWS